MITLWLLKKLLEFVELLTQGFVFLVKVVLYMTIGLINVFTIPLWLLFWIFCRIIKVTTPGMKRWKTILYPSWEGRYTYYPTKIKSVFVNQNTSSMSGYDFEYYCSELLKAKGMKDVYVTPSSGDYGADIVATDKDGVRWVFQCKKYSSVLGNTPIQEVIASKAHYGARKAGVMTNSTFTDNARLLAMENDILLWELID